MESSNEPQIEIRYVFYAPPYETVCTTKSNKLAWLVNQITDHDVETFEAAVCAHI